MKLALIVAVAVLALAHGSFAQEATDLQKIGQYFEEMRTKMTQDLTEFMRTQDLTGHAQSLQTQLEPLASQVQEQLKTVAASVEEQIKPMAASVQAQIQPMVTEFQKQMETIFQQLTEQAKAIGN